MKKLIVCIALVAGLMTPAITEACDKHKKKAAKAKAKAECPVSGKKASCDKDKAAGCEKAKSACQKETACSKTPSRQSAAAKGSEALRN